MDGSEKMPLLVTRQSKKPRCFKHVKFLPNMYSHNSNAWINCALFMEFQICLERMAAKNWKMLQFLDHCAPPFPEAFLTHHSQSETSGNRKIYIRYVWKISKANYDRYVQRKITHPNRLFNLTMTA
jgi:hypothetical protein